MKKCFKAAAVLGLGFAFPANALDFGNGFSVTGEFELEYFSSEGSSETIGYGSVDVSYEQAGGGLGGFVGFDALSYSGDANTALYGAVTFSGGFGKVQFGSPRSALDDYIKVPILGGARLLDLEFAFLNGSLFKFARLSLESSEIPLGLRYDGEIGQARIGASIHRLDGVTIAALAANYPLGNVVLRGGIEQFDGEDGSGTILHFGANANLGQLETGVMLTKTDTDEDDELISVQVFATYSPMEKLDLTFSAVSVQGDDFDGTLYGLSADYTFAQGVFVQAGVFDGADTEGGYNLSVGVRF